MGSEPIQSAEPGGNGLTTAVAAALADERRLEIVARLVGRECPLSERDLAREIAISGTDRSPSDAAAEGCRDTTLALYHRDLPALEAADLIVRYHSLDMVGATDHPILDAVDVTSLSGTRAEAEAWEAIAAVLERPLRQHVLAVLAEAGSPVGFEDLATEVAVRGDGSRASGPGGDDVQQVRTRLHHVALPKLEDAGLLAVDRDRETAEYRADGTFERLADSAAPGWLPSAVE